MFAVPFRAVSSYINPLLYFAVRIGKKLWKVVFSFGMVNILCIFESVLLYSLIFIFW